CGEGSGRNQADEARRWSGPVDRDGASHLGVSEEEGDGIRGGGPEGGSQAACRREAAKGRKAQGWVFLRAYCLHECELRHEDCSRRDLRARLERDELCGSRGGREDRERQRGWPLRRRLDDQPQDSSQGCEGG